MKLSKLFPNLAILLMGCLIIGCSGGGTGGSTSSINSPPPSSTDSSRPSISLSNYALRSNETISVNVRFTDSNGKRAVRVPVTFETSPHMGTFPNGLATGQATTDLFGNAQIAFSSANITGVGVITATAIIDGSPVPQYATFFVNTPPLKLAPISVASSLTGGTSTAIRVNILDANGAAYTGQDVDVYFNSEYGAFNEWKVRSSGGVVSNTYFAPNISSLPFTETITANLGDSTVTAYVRINPNPNGIPSGAKLTLATATDVGWDATKFSGVVVSGNKVTLVDTAGLPIVNYPVKIEVTLVDGYVSPFTVTLNGITLEDAATPISTITMFTDSTGSILLPTLYQGANPSNYIVYYRASTVIGGVTFVSTSNQKVAVTLGAATPVAPGAPTNVTAAQAAASGSITVTFVAPVNDGGGAITKYTVTPTPAVAGNLLGADLDANTASLTHRFVGLTPGASYSFTVTATNSAGTGPSSLASALVAATP
jgi:hypothetical protein